MKKLLDFSAAFPLTVLFVIVAISALAATQMQHLEIKISAQSIAVDDDPAWLAQQQNIAQFGNDSLVIVLLNDQQLFTQEKLLQVHALISGLESLKEVAKVDSLFSTPDIRSIDGYVETRPYLSLPLPDDDVLEEILFRARSNPMARGNFIAADGNTMGINISLTASQAKDFDQQITSRLNTLLAPYHQQFEQVVVLGSPIVRQAISEKIQQDQLQIMPLSMLILGIALFLGLRRVSGVVVPAFTAGVSIIWTLALMALFQIPLGVMTSIVPALLIIIGSTEDVHLLAEYQHAREQKMSAREALLHMNNHMGLAIMLTFITTYLGFLSILMNDINLLKEFAVVASTGLLINFLVTSFSVPAILQLSANTRYKTRSATQSNFYQRFALAGFQLTLKRPVLTALMLLTAMGFFAYGIHFVKVNNNPLGYFDKDNALVQDTRLMHEQLAGTQVMTILLQSGIDGTFKKVKYLEELQKLQDYLARTGNFDISLSFADFIKYVHFGMENDAPLAGDALYLPEVDNQIEEYMLFIKHELVASFVTENYAVARILVRHAIENSTDLNRAVADLQLFIDENSDQALKISITGESVVSSHAADYLARGQAESLLIMAVVIFLIVSLLFIDYKAGLLALVSNAFPIIVLFGVMGYLAIPLDTGTAMVAVIALGICVDDTVHFMSRYHQRTRNQSDISLALKQTVSDESIPIMTTSVALAAGFAVFAFSNFVPVVNFGLLSALVMVLAVMSTFLIMPLLLSYTRLITMWDMLSLQLQSDVVKNCPLFTGMSNWGIRQTILSSEIREFKQHQRIITQDSVGEEMYVILEGHAIAHNAKVTGSINVLNHFSAGDLFGEIALISKVPRTASIDAASDCRLLVMKWDDILRMSRLHTRLAAILFRNLAGIVGSRMQNNNDAISKLNIDDMTGAYSRVFAKEQIALELRRSQRHKESLLLVYVKIKVQGEKYRYQDVLPKIAAAITQSIRNVDIYIRWGWCSFVVMLPRVNDNCEQIIVERISENMHSIAEDEENQLALEISTIEYDKEEDAQLLIESLDKILLTDEEVVDRKICASPAQDEGHKVET